MRKISASKVVQIIDEATSEYRYSTQPEKAAIELIDAVYDLVELYKPESPSQEAWKKAWLKKANELGITADW